ncbi:MAG: SufE family protein [Gemmatimonadetes bacterium]|nr:SufE family protein [Gemmatimonadota bacterium]MYF73032.1 SufE family protein [Gemmatimonadota bacterium]MYK50985.1 SufE family protein [Gemmatimonadota bacterium]
MDITIDRIMQNFDVLTDWEDRYRYIIELGRKLPPFDEEYKVDDNLVRGCVSQVWLVTDVRDGDPPVIEFRADSDAQIVKGLVAILLSLYSGKTAREILTADIRSIFQQLELAKHLSINRANGFASMVKRIHELALATAA